MIGFGRVGVRIEEGAMSGRDHVEESGGAKPLGATGRATLAGRSRLGLALGLLSAALLMLAPAAVSAAVAKWNQERVTKIATQLSEAADNVYESVHKMQAPAAGAAGFSSFYRFKENVRVIKNSADYLATRLQKGGSREETYPTFRRMMLLIRQARDDSRRVGTIPDDTLQAIDHAGDLVRQIRPYYEDMSKGEPKATEEEE